MPIPVSPVIYSVQVDGQAILDVPLDVELRMSWGMHDMFFVRIAAPLAHSHKHSLTTWADNAPVQIVWGRGADNIQPWYGYVAHHEFNTVEDSGVRAIQITYVILGTSKPMNSHKSRTWQNITPEAIAGQIASEYGLRCIATPTNWVLDYETQANTSDFSFLNYLAKKVGRRFWVSGGTMYFIDPAVLLASTSTYSVPQYRIDQYLGHQDSAKDFHLMRGDQLPGSELATRSIYGFDQSGNLIVAQAGGIQNLQLVNSTRVARSLGEAQNYINAEQSLAQFWLRGCVEVFGYTLLYPGKVIHLAGDSMLDETQGYWVVTGVRHILRTAGMPNPALDSYVTRVEIIRNTSSQSPVVTGVHRIRPEIIKCTLMNSTWMAVQRGLSYDGMVAG